MKNILTGFAAVCGLFLVGCMPTERFWWSPDGKRAVVVVDQMAQVVDANGGIEMALPIEKAARKTLLDDVDWFSDGNRFVAHRVQVLEKWEQAKSLIPDSEANRIEELARGMPNLLASAVLVGGDAEQATRLLERISGENSGLLLNAFLLALESRPEKVREALSQAPKSLSALEEDRQAFEGFLVHEIAVVDLTFEREFDIEVLLRSSEAIGSPVISPDGSSIAISRGQSNGNLFALDVLRVEDGQGMRVANRVHDSFEWVDDGRSVVFMAPVANEGILKQIKKVTVFDDSGKRLDRGEHRTTNLATAVVPFAPRIEKLPGNSLLFASQNGSLPVASVETPYEANLYRVSAEGGPVERVATSPGALPMNLGFFVVSPNGENVAVVESDTDAVAVVDLKSGQTELVSPANPNWRCRTLPAWKGEDELTFAALNPELGRIEWRLWDRNGKGRILGENWSDEDTADWLEKKEDER